jgi:hypothetical protein
MLGDVVYACTTCFDAHLLFQLVKKFTLLKPGSRVILMDSLVLSINKDTPSQFLEILTIKNDGVLCDLFTLIGSCQCKTTWGYGCSYIFIKKF